MANANVNTIVMSFWGTPFVQGNDCGFDGDPQCVGLSQFSAYEGPMMPTWPTSYDNLFVGVTEYNSEFGANVSILPAIEGIPTGDCDTTTPASEYPGSYGVPSTFLLRSVDALVQRYILGGFGNFGQNWTQLYDQTGAPRFAINLLHLASLNDPLAQDFANGLDWLADWFYDEYGVLIGFTIDPWDATPLCPSAAFNPTPQNTMATVGGSTQSVFVGVNSFLGIQAFNPEITVGGVDPQNSYPNAPLNSCVVPHKSRFGSTYSFTCTDQNLIPANLAGLDQWKRTNWTRDWIQTYVPVILDTSPGYDGHIVFGTGSPVGLYGDNSQDHINDTWRNHESQMKRGLINLTGGYNVGMVYNAWNGFAESLTAVPSYFVSQPDQVSANAYDNQLGWLTNQYSVDPRFCDHMHYADGSYTGLHVFGGICAVWECFGSQDSYGAPVGNAAPTPGGEGVSQDFENGGTIYWNLGTNIGHEVHGTINTEYIDLGADSSSLGMPLSDQYPIYSNSCGDGEANQFEGGEIDWYPTCGVFAFSYPGNVNTPSVCEDQ